MIMVFIGSCGMIMHGEMHVVQFEWLPFGNKSSAFLLNATIKHNLQWVSLQLQIILDPW